MRAGVVEIMTEDGARPPRYVNGVYKIYASRPGVIASGSGGKIEAGFRMRIPRDYFGKVQRSVVKTLGGVIDSDYRGEVCVLVYNDSNKEFAYSKGDEVAEMAVCRVITPAIEVVGPGPDSELPL